MNSWFYQLGVEIESMLPDDAMCVIIWVDEWLNTNKRPHYIVYYVIYMSIHLSVHIYFTVKLHNF